MEYGDNGGQRFYVMWGISYKEISFPHSFFDQAKLTIFQLTHTAVDHMRGGRAGPGAKVAAIN